jgi:8-amino-7-oxononanoate synthase
VSANAFAHPEERARSGESALDRLAAEKLGAIRARGTYRRMRVLAGAQAERMEVDGRSVLLFAGSTYLGLAHHPEVVEASVRASRDYGCAAGGSRLISGNLDLHEALESELAAFVGMESALAFGTGYMANVGVIPALVGRGDTVVSDALCHASIIDGCKLSGAAVRVVPHGDVSAFDAAIEAATRAGGRVLVALDGVYSMDGDVAPLPALFAAARRHGALVLLDDAHGMGALGAGGRGCAELLGVEGQADVLLGTLGKAFGSFGAFVAGSAALRDLLVNTARSFIFSCALAPPQIEAARAALRVLVREPWRREQLAANAARLRARLAAHGLSTEPSTTHIVPVVLGDNARTMAACEALLDRGFYAQGIRHPSVPEGTARLRLTPMATHEEADIDALADAVAEVAAAAR